eukprot:scaffold131660_cov63-Phaeocystis_antarctica.AAC.4
MRCTARTVKPYRRLEVLVYSSAHLRGRARRRAFSWVLRERCERGRAAGRAAAPRGGRRENILPFDSGL